MPLKYGDALRDVTLQQIMSIIKIDEKFKWCYAAIKAVESEQNQKFDIYASKDLSNKKTKEWAFVESLYANDKFEARKHRKMKRYPQYNYGVIVNFEKDEKPVVRVHYFYNDRDDKIAKLSLSMKVVEDYLEYKGFETSEEVTKFVRDKEDEYDKLYMLMQSGKLPTRSSLGGIM